MQRTQLSNRSSLSSVTNDKYIDTDSDGDSYWTEPTILNSDTDSTAKSKNAYKASA